MLWSKRFVGLACGAMMALSVSVPAYASDPILPLPTVTPSPTVSASPSPQPSASPSKKRTKKPKKKLLAASLVFTLANPYVRTYPDGTAAAVNGRVDTAEGSPAAGVPIRVERQINTAAWQDIGGITSAANGTWTFQARAWSALLIHYRLRVVGDTNWPASLSGLVTHEARNDPLDYKQVSKLVSVARSSGIAVSIGFVDRMSGRVYSYKTVTAAYYTASVAKVIIAMDVLHNDMDAGRTTPSDANVAAIRKMIRVSDNDAAWAYWNKYGQSAMYDRVNKRCGTSLPMAPPAGWGRSAPPPAEVALVLDCLADYRAINAGLSEWLLGEMRATATSQRWGIPAANPDPFRVEANKNGWSTWSTVSFRTVNSVGVFGPNNRYTLAIFTQYPNNVAQSKGEATINALTQAMFPAGTIVS
jgi:hypothetical protein